MLNSQVLLEQLKTCLYDFLGEKDSSSVPPWGGSSGTRHFSAARFTRLGPGCRSLLFLFVSEKCLSHPFPILLRKILSLYAIPDFFEEKICRTWTRIRLRPDKSGLRRTVPIIGNAYWQKLSQNPSLNTSQS